jgi:hypothetical protein
MYFDMLIEDRRRVQVVEGKIVIFNGTIIDPTRIEQECKELYFKRLNGNGKELELYIDGKPTSITARDLIITISRHKIDGETKTSFKFYMRIHSEGNVCIIRNEKSLWKELIVLEVNYLKFNNVQRVFLDHREVIIHDFVKIDRRRKTVDMSGFKLYDPIITELYISLSNFFLFSLSLQNFVDLKKPETPQKTGRFWFFGEGIR